MKIVKNFKRLAQFAAVFFVLGTVVQISFAAQVSADAPDPAMNYLYGGQESDCVSGDFVTKTVNNYPLGTHCLRLSNDKSTYSISAPVNGACPDVFGSRGVLVAGPFGPACAYFPPGKVQTAPASITFTPVSQSQTSKNFAAQSCTKDATNDNGVCNVKGECNADTLDASNCSIIHWALIAINTLAALVGLTVVIMIIVAGIQYSSAADDPQKVAQARARIVNAIIALAAFIFMYAFLQWIVPGGVL